jgi:hypothetical protein
VGLCLDRVVRHNRSSKTTKPLECSEKARKMETEREGEGESLLIRTLHRNLLTIGLSVVCRNIVIASFVATHKFILNKLI